MNSAASAKKNKMRNSTACTSVRAAITSSADTIARAERTQNEAIGPNPSTLTLLTPFGEPPRQTRRCSLLRHRGQRIPDQPDVPRPLHRGEAQRPHVADDQHHGQQHVDYGEDWQ